MCFRFLQLTSGFLKTGELPHHDHGHVEGLDEAVAQIDANPYNLDDNLHMHDLKYKERHPEQHSGPSDQGGSAK